MKRCGNGSRNLPKEWGTFMYSTQVGCAGLLSQQMPSSYSHGEQQPPEICEYQPIYGSLQSSVQKAGSIKVIMMMLCCTSSTMISPIHWTIRSSRLNFVTALPVIKRHKLDIKVICHKIVTITLTVSGSHQESAHDILRFFVNKVSFPKFCFKKSSKF